MRCCSAEAWLPNPRRGRRWSEDFISSTFRRRDAVRRCPPSIVWIIMRRSQLAQSGLCMCIRECGASCLCWCEREWRGTRWSGGVVVLRSDGSSIQHPEHNSPLCLAQEFAWLRASQPARVVFRPRPPQPSRSCHPGRLAQPRPSKMPTAATPQRFSTRLATTLRCPCSPLLQCLQPAWIVAAPRQLPENPRPPYGLALWHRKSSVEHEGPGS
jgi:hypothetical protein